MQPKMLQSLISAYLGGCHGWPDEASANVELSPLALKSRTNPRPHECQSRKTCIVKKIALQQSNSIKITPTHRLPLSIDWTYRTRQVVK
jgi:hypothetical protein